MLQGSSKSCIFDRIFAICTFFRSCYTTWVCMQKKHACVLRSSSMYILRDNCKSDVTDNELALCRFFPSCCTIWMWMQKIQKVLIGVALPSTPALTVAANPWGPTSLLTLKSLLGFNRHRRMRLQLQQVVAAYTEGFA